MVQSNNDVMNQDILESIQVYALPCVTASWDERYGKGHRRQRGRMQPEEGANRLRDEEKTRSLFHSSLSLSHHTTC